MKTLRLPLLAVLVSCAMACNKGNVTFNGNTNANTTATDQAAGLVTASLASNSNGAFNTMSDVSVETQAHVSIDSLCGTTWTDSISRNRTASQNNGVAYSYSAKYTYTLNCDSVTKKGIYNGSSTATSVYSGSYSGPNLSSTNSGSSLLVIQGLGHGSNVYTVNGEYKQEGTYSSKTDTGTNNVDIKLTNIVLTKPFQFVQSGTATISVSGVSSKNGSFSYNGVLVFGGSNTATLTLNGTVYNIDLMLGTYKRRQ
jgi:hypothetical protein